MTTIGSRARHALAVLGALWLVAACSAPGSTPGSGATAGAGPTAAAATSGAQATAPTGTTTTGGTGGGTAVTDACALLSAADIKEITGFEVAKTVPNPPDTILPAACEWTVVGAAWQIYLGVASPGGQAAWDKLAPYTQGTAVTGIGDQALLAEMAGDLMVRRGDSFIDMQYVAAGPSDDIQERLAKRALEHLP